MPNDTAKSDEYNNGTSVRVCTQCYISACIYMTPIEIVRVPLSNSKPRITIPIPPKNLNQAISENLEDEPRTMTPIPPEPLNQENPENLDDEPNYEPGLLNDAIPDFQPRDQNLLTEYNDIDVVSTLEELKRVPVATRRRS